MRLALRKRRTCGHVYEHYHLEVGLDQKTRQNLLTSVSALIFDSAQAGYILSALCETQSASPTLNHNYDEFVPFLF